MGLFGKKQPFTGEDPVVSHDPYYHYYPAPFTHPGTGNFVFLPRQSNPALNIFGPTVLYGHAPDPLQPPPIEALAARTTSGIGGLQAGTMALQPLFDMNISNNQTEQI